MIPPEADSSDVCRRLEEILEDRKQRRPTGSYVVELLEGGHPVQAGKVVEEAYELIEACAEENHPAAVHEAADLIFHLLVLLCAQEIRWNEVEAELERRFGIGGLTEKRQRPPRGT